MMQLSDGRTFISANASTPKTIYASSHWVLCIIDDQYAKKDSLFTFRIPLGSDSLSHTYTPLATPSGMQVSAGGTITWTPTTDSASKEHVEYVVAESKGGKDTLSFNLWVNGTIESATRPTTRKSQPYMSAHAKLNHLTNGITFEIAPSTSAIDIYDTHGRLVQSLKPSANAPRLVWNGTDLSGNAVAAGRYLARVKANQRENVLPVMLVR
jgi:hypothetical protein